VLNKQMRQRGGCNLLDQEAGHEDYVNICAMSPGVHL